MNPRIEGLGRRAAAALAAGGRRAFAQGDMPAAVSRLSRARLLLAEHDPDRLDLLPQLAFAFLETGDFAGSEAVFAEATESARDSGDSRLQAHALVLSLSMGLWSDPEGWTREAEATAPQAIATFEEVGDERGLAHAWSLLGLVHLSRAHFGPAEAAWRKAATHAHLAGDRRDELESLSWVPLTGGPVPHATTSGDAARFSNPWRETRKPRPAASWPRRCSRPAWPRRRGAHAHRAGSSASRGGRIDGVVGRSPPSSPVGPSCSQTTYPRQSES